MGYEVHIDWAGGTTFAGTADDVSANVARINITRGRDSALSAFQAGQATVELVDTTGVWNPAADLTVRPGLPIRVRYVDAGGTAHGLFSGFVEQIEHTPHGGDNAGRTTFACRDALALIDRFQPSVTWSEGQNSAAAIGTILGYAGTALTDRVPLNIGTVGSTMPAGSAAGDTSALSEIGNVLAVDLGEFYVDRWGTVTYNARNERWSRASAGTVTDLAAGITPSSDITRVVNRQTASADGTVFATQDNTTSQGDYGIRQGPTVTNPYFGSSAVADAYASWVVNTQGSAVVLLSRLEFRTVASQSAEGGSVFPLAYRRDLTDRVTVVDTAAGIGTVDVMIESVQHDITPDGHVFSWGVAPRPSFGTVGTDWTPFTIGGPGTGSTLASGDILVY